MQASKIFFIPLVYMSALFGAKIVEFVPASPGDELFTPGVPYWEEMNRRLGERGYRGKMTRLDSIPKKGKKWYKRVFYWQQPKYGIDRIVTFNLPYYIHFNKFKQINRKKLVLIALEPPVVIPRQHERRMERYFSKIYTFDDDKVDNRQYFKLFMSCLYPMRKELVPFEKRKFCCLINADKNSDHPLEAYSKRRDWIRFFERTAPHLFDLYGVGWAKEQYPSYLGKVDDKLGTLANYRYSIVIENTTHMKGYITEKIFDAFSAGVVPVYLGAPNVTDYIPENCFIDLRDFRSYHEVLEHLKSLSKTEFEAYLEAIRTFLKSDGAKRFSSEHFQNLLIEAATT